MEWAAISGSWRTITPEVEADVRADVSRILTQGNGIVTGGALGVDYIATDEALKHDPACHQLRIILPTPLAHYAAHYFNAAGKKIISHQQSWDLIRQLGHVKRTNPAALIEMAHEACNPITYYDRNTEVVKAASRLFAYQVNASAGTQDAIDKARALRLPVLQRRYTA